MNQLSLFGDSEPTTPGPYDIPAPAPTRRTPDPKSLDFAGLIERWGLHSSEKPLLSKPWRANIGGTTMCFVVTPFVVFGVETAHAPGVTEMDTNSLQGASSARGMLADVARDTQGGDFLSKDEIERFATWCGVPVQPMPNGESYKHAKERTGEFASFPNCPFDRNILSQVIHCLGDFYDCDRIYYSALRREKNALFSFRGEWDDKTPGWRVVLSGLEYSDSANAEVFA